MFFPGESRCQQDILHNYDTELRKNIFRLLDKQQSKVLAEVHERASPLNNLKFI